MKLLSRCVAPSKLIVPEAMAHNEYNMSEDILKPICQFMQEISCATAVSQSKAIRPVPQAMRLPPAVLINKEQLGQREKIYQRISKE